jgi:glycosyltransferase involved in cell wall biosynthesis
MANGLAKRGHDIDVHIMDSRADYSKASIRYNIINHKESNDKEPLAHRILRLRKYVSDISSDYDIIHVFEPDYLPIVGAVAHKIAIPIVGRLNTYTPVCTNMSKMDGVCQRKCNIVKRFNHDSKRGINKLARIPIHTFSGNIGINYANNLDKFFALSPTVKQIYTDFGYDSDKIEIIPNIIDRTLVGGKAHRSKRQFRLLFVGRLTKSKGIHVVMKALQNLNLQKIRFDIVGDGNFRGELEKMDNEIPKNIEVIFHGYVPNNHLYKYYNNADLFIHCHLWPEPFGRVIIESLQHNLPVLTSEVGAPKWIAGESCVTVPRNRPDLVKEMLLDLLHEPKKLYQMGKNCEIQLMEFKSEYVLNKIEKNYYELFKQYNL